MAIFPSDDLSLSATTRKRLRPLISAYKSYYADNVKRNAITTGNDQARDPWLGKTKWIAECSFDLKIDDVELIQSFLRVNRVAGFTMFDFEQRQIGSPGYEAAINIGTGDGVTATFTIPAREIDQPTAIVYVNGAAKTVTVDFNWGARSGTLLDGPGAQGEDTVVFIAGHIPAAAAAITIAFKGRCRYNVIIPAPPDKGASDWNRQQLSFRAQEKF